MDSAFPITPELESQALKVLQSDYTYLAALLAPLDLPDGYSQPSRSRTMFTFLRRFHAGPLSVRLCQVLRNSPFVYTRTHAATLLRTLLPAFPPIVKTTLLECLREESYPQVLKPLSHVLFDIMDRAPWPELMNFLLKSVWEDGKQRIQVNCLVVFAHWRNFEILKPHWEGLQEAILRKLGFGEDSDVQDAAFRAALNFLQPSSNLSTRDQNEEHLCRMLKALCQLLLHFNEEGVARMRKMAEMLTSDGKWSDLFILLSMCVTSELKILQESALLIFSKLHNWSPPTKPLIPHREDLRLAFLHALDSSELSTRLTAFCAVVSLTLMKVFEKVSDFLEKMLSLLFELVDNKEEASVQKALSELHGWAVAMPGIMKLRLELVFRCLVQFADCDELEDRTRFLSVQILVDMAKNAPGMMRGLRPTVMKTLFSAIIRMLSDIEEPRILTREMGFLNQLSVALCGSTVMPIATELLLEYLSNEEWQKRRAGLIAFAVIVDGSPMVMPMYLDQILGIVLKLFKDSNPGVRQAASYVIEKLSVELSPQLQIQYHHQVMPALAPAIEDFENPKEQMNAILALFFFSKGCTSDIIAPYLDEIVNGLLEILQKENQTQKLQGAALAALSFVATSSQNYFQKYYNNVMPRLRTILQAAFDTDKRTVCAKSVECICSVAAAVGKHTVGTDAEQVLAQLLPMQVSLKERDNPIRSYLMQGWVKLYKCLGTEFVPHMNDLMPHFLQYANEFIDEKFTERLTFISLLFMSSRT
ncbi:importin subunit beta-3-like [Malania oleifera]|uniref:importin subunit beta-3-like n=1 Tax=Malania oleifera TaxID=397392 RepID=UPI0025AE73E9|nr:importin subunit beta-3-like [Malania oleifera]